MWRAGWTHACATPDQVEKITRDQFKFPNARNIVAALDKSYGTGTFFRRLHVRVWTPLNSYTHSGKFQLGSRFTGSDLEPSYSDDEKIMAVNGTLIAAAMTAILVLKAHGRMDDAARVEAILGRIDKAPAPIT